MKIADLFSVEGKVVLVTGGSRGIGEMIARAYVDNGAKVYISSRNAEACDRLAEDLSPHGSCVSIPADLSQLGEIERLASEIEKQESELHILVNNAGTTWAASFDALPEKGWDKVMDLNVKTPYFLSQRLVGLLEKSGTPDDLARIINICSIDGLHVSIVEAHSYSASKAGLIHLTRSMAKSLAPRNIGVNGIAPGLFPSKLTANMPADISHIALKGTPLGRFGRAADMAGLALFLGSKASSYVCGAIIELDGGFATTL